MTSHLPFTAGSNLTYLVSGVTSDIQLNMIYKNFAPISIGLPLKPPDVIEYRFGRLCTMKEQEYEVRFQATPHELAREKPYCYRSHYSTHYILCPINRIFLTGIFLFSHLLTF